jgi:hypothetical protein
VGGESHLYRSEDEWAAFAERLKITPCPHCKKVGNLIRHGSLHGFDDASPPRQTLRARRVYCSNRHRRNGCGRTFSVWIADKLQRLSLSTRPLWRFLQHAIAGSLTAAIRAMTASGDTGSSRSPRSWQRLWKRFDRSQSAIRTALLARAPPVSNASIAAAHRPAAAEVLAHLQAAFPHEDCPIAAYQHAMQAFFL